MALEFSAQIFEKYSNTIFHENLSSGSRNIPCGRTDKYMMKLTRFSKFCECAKMHEHS